MASPRGELCMWNDLHSGDHEEDNRTFDSDSLTDTDVADSIEKPDYDVTKLCDYDTYANRNRHFSSATAIRVDDDPFADDHHDQESAGYHPKVKVRYHDLEEDPFSEDDDEFSMQKEDDRKISSSQTISTMPEDLDPPSTRSPRPSSSLMRGTPNANPRRNDGHQRLLSSPGRQERSPRPFSPATPRSGHDRFVSSPLARHTSGFRNPSSIRAMQMSSPSPPASASPNFAHSPRSARQRRFEAEQQRSRSGTPRAHPNPNKEYPLILLHCSFTPIFLDHPTPVLNAALPPWLLQNLSLLGEKLNATIVDRGVLIPHPGEDYELLEERILESLELKKPRLSKCGHFVGTRSSSSTAVESDDGKIEADFEHAHPTCNICNKHVADDHRGAEGDALSRRFELKIYASNGLMRAGAWSAAWREMEKIDVEIGVWLPEEVRQKLEEEASKYYDQWERQGLERVRELRMEMPFAPTPPPAVRHLESEDARHRGMSRKVTEMRFSDQATSTAPCHKPKIRPVTEARYTQQPATERPRSSHAWHAAHEQLPLSTLLARFVRRKCEPTKDLFLQVMIVILAIIVFRQWWAPVAAAPSLVSLASHVQPLDNLQASLSTANSRSISDLTTVTATVTSTAMAASNLAAAATAANIPLCTFSPSEASQHGMAAVPLEMATRMLGEEATAAITSDDRPISGMGPQPTGTGSTTSDRQVSSDGVDEEKESTQPANEVGSDEDNLDFGNSEDGMEALGD